MGQHDYIMRHDPKCKLCHGDSEFPATPDELAEFIPEYTNHKAQVEMIFEWFKSLTMRGVTDHEDRAALLLAFERIRIHSVDKGKSIGVIPCDFDL